MYFKYLFDSYIFIRMNALELQQSFTDARAIRVVIVPVGDISEEKFKEYSDLIKSLGVIELSNITRNSNDPSMLYNNIIIKLLTYLCRPI